MTEHPSALIEALSERELEVLQAMSEGLSNQEIANSLYVALPTVKWYNTQIYSKMGVSNRQEAVEQAQKLGLLDAAKESLPDVPNNLTQQTTPFIGRDAELQELNDLLNNPDVRLVTVLAQGGMGKTRLLMQSAEQQLQHFSDGVFFIELAPLVKAEGIAQLIAETLDIVHYDSGGNMKKGVVQYLSSKKLLLLLDNFEHLLEGANIIGDILQATPDVKILVSSRERLNLRGETVFTLGGMRFPDLDDSHSADYDSIRLFLDGARRVRSDFEVTEQELSQIVQICQLVEGMPLAIELASGWLDALTLEQIIRELHTGIDFLETEMRDMPKRHRSIRATFNQSWERLSEADQNTMMRLSIFRGGCTQEAAITVAETNIRSLRRLVNKSLLYVDVQGRYGNHELLRQYCEEKLQESGDYEAALDDHAAYYADYMEKAKPKIEDIDPLIYRAMDKDIDNLTMAWEHILQQENLALLRKIEPLQHHWHKSGRAKETIALVQAAFELVHSKMGNQADLIILCVELLHNLTFMEERSESDKQGRILKRIEQEIELLEPLGFSYILMWAYKLAAHNVIWHPANFDLAKVNLEKGLALAEKQGDLAFQAITLYYMASNYYRNGDKEIAWKILQEAEQRIDHQSFKNTVRLEIFEQVIHIYLDAQAYEQAETLCDETLFLAECMEYMWYISIAINAKVQIVFARGDIQEAKRLIASIIHWHQTHARDWQMLGALWSGYAKELLMHINQDEYAVEILSFVYNHPVTVQTSLDGAKSCLDELHSRMDAELFEAAYERGKQKELKQVVADAMAFLSADEVL